MRMMDSTNTPETLKHVILVICQGGRLALDKLLGERQIKGEVRESRNFDNPKLLTSFILPDS